MAPKEVSVPTGGRVWLRTRLTHGQEREREDAQAALPAGALARLAVSLESGDRGGLEDADVAVVTRGMRGVDEATLRVCIVRSEGVRDPDGSAVELPADIDRLDQEDFAFLVDAAVGALAEGRGDPNPSRGSSETPSSPAGSVETSPRTFGTPS